MADLWRFFAVYRMTSAPQLTIASTISSASGKLSAVRGMTDVGVAVAAAAVAAGAVAVGAGEAVGVAIVRRAVEQALVAAQREGGVFGQESVVPVEEGGDWRAFGFITVDVVVVSVQRALVIGGAFDFQLDFVVVRGFTDHLDDDLVAGRVVGQAVVLVILSQNQLG